MAYSKWHAGEEDVNSALYKTRPSISLGLRCSPALVMRSDASACRAAYQGSDLDVIVFEQAHREFCRRIEHAGVAKDERVVRELAKSGFCGRTNFSNADQVCL